MNEVVVILVSGAISITTVLGAEWLRGRNAARAAAVAAAAATNAAATTQGGENHRADLESKSALEERLMKRLAATEERLDQTIEHARGQDKRIGSLVHAVHRIGWVYDDNLQLLRRVNRHWREGKPLDEDLAREVDMVPDFSQVLAGFPPGLIESNASPLPPTSAGDPQPSDAAA